MSANEKPEPVTPVHRRLLKTDVPGVYKRGARYVAITQYRGRRIKTSHRTKAQARRAKAERTAGVRPTSRERFEAYTERWLVEYTGRTAGGLLPATREAYAASMRAYVIPYFQGFRIGDVGPLDVKRFIGHLTQLAPRRSQRGAQRLAPSTIRRIMTPLKAMLAEARELEVIHGDPGRVRIVIPGEPSPQPPKTMTPAQIDAILQGLVGHDRVLFFLLSRTGVRISEALGLQWHDVETTMDGAVIAIRRRCCDGEVLERTKTDAGARRVALVPSLHRALRAHRADAVFGADEDPIFPSNTGAAQDDHNLRRRLRRVVNDNGVPWVTPHVFRHSLATELYPRDAHQTNRMLLPWD